MTELALAGRTVVLTRPSTGTLGGRLGALGATVAHVPLITIGPPADDGAALRTALGSLATFDWLVVTSTNGAAAVGEAIARAGAVRLAAVGTATATALEARARRAVDLVPTDANSDGLVAAFPVGPHRVLVAQADRAGDRLAAALRAGGHEVVAVEAYSTRPRPPDASERRLLGDAAVVVLASGSAVEAWAHAVDDGGLANVSAAVVTIGQRTAGVAVDHGLAVAAVASAPTDDAIVAAVLAAVARLGSSGA